MTVATEAAAAKRPGAWQRLAPYAAPALILLSIVVPFLHYHEYSLLAPESLLLIGGTILVGAAAGGISRLHPALGPILMVVLLGVFVVYRKEIHGPLVRAVVELGQAIGHAGLAFGLVGLALFLASGSIAWLLRRHLDSIVVAVFGTFVMTVIALPSSSGGEPVETGSLPAELQDLPPLIHIILDEHIGLAGLPPEMAESASAARAIETTYKDFALFSRAYSRFAETQLSLASLFNRGLWEDVDAALETRNSGYTLLESAWFDRLKNEGYALRVYQSNWLDMCSRLAMVGSCHTYSINSPNPIQRTGLTTFAKLQVLLAWLHIGSADQLPSPLASMEALERLKSDIAQAPRGVAFVVHLLMPHDGYLYKSDCTLGDPSQWGEAVRDHGVTAEVRTELYRLYIEQLTCTSLAIEGLLDELKQLGIYEEATIIVHGDHGSRIGERAKILDSPPSLTQQDLRDHYSTLLAIKSPAIVPGLREEPESVQSAFSDIFLGGGRGDPGPVGQVLLRQMRKGPFHAFTLVWPSDAIEVPGDAFAATRSTSGLPDTE